MKVTYIGHSAVLLEEEGFSLIVDPFVKDSPTAPQGIYDKLKPSHIFLTHGHEDHVGDTVELAKEHGSKAVAVFELANFLQSQGVEEVVPCGLGGRVGHEFGWSKLVPAFHSSSYEGKYMGMPAGVMLGLADKVFYHMGDTCLFGDLKLYSELYQPEIVFIPIGGHFTMDVFEAVKACELIGPATYIPIHYDTWPPIAADSGKFKSQVEALGEGYQVVLLKPGESQEF